MHGSNRNLYRHCRGHTGNRCIRIYLAKRDPVEVATYCFKTYHFYFTHYTFYNCNTSLAPISLKIQAQECNKQNNLA